MLSGSGTRTWADILPNLIEQHIPGLAAMLHDASTTNAWADAREQYGRDLPDLGTEEFENLRTSILKSAPWIATLQFKDANGKAPTLREYSRVFQEWVNTTSSLKPQSKNVYSYGVKLLLTTKLSDVRLDRITNADVQTCEFSGPAAANVAIACLQRMFSLAKETRRYYGEIPTLERRKAPGRGVAMTIGDAEKIAARMTGDPRDVLLILRHTGMRPAELFCSRWEFIDLEHGYYRVQESKTEAGKRPVPLLGESFAIFKRRHFEQGMPVTGWIFPSATHKSGHLKSIRAEFNKARNAAGFGPEMVLYTARHGYGTAVAEVVSTKQLQGLLGHSEPVTTFKYQHPAQMDRELLEAKLTGRVM